MSRIARLLSLFFIAFTQVNAFSATENNSCSPQIKSLFDQNLGAIIGKNVVGAEVGVYDGKSTCFISYGHTSIGGASPTPNTIFGIGSITKTFTSDLTSLAVEYDVLGNGLKTSIYRDSANGNEYAKYAGFNLLPGAQAVTFLELATFRAGLPDEAPEIGPHTAYSYNDFVNYIDSWQPGQLPAPELYSNVSFALLGHVATAALYKSPNSPLKGRYPEYYQAVKALILDPLQMNSTYIYTDNPDLKSRTATHYTYYADNNTFKLLNVFYREPINPAGAINSSVSDLLIFAQAHLGVNPIVGPDNQTITIDKKLSDAMKMSTLCYAPIRKNLCQGLAWVTITQQTGNKVIFKNGATIGGYTSFIGLDMDKKMAVVILTNTNSGTNHQNLHIIYHVQNTGLAALKAMASS